MKISLKINNAAIDLYLKPTEVVAGEKIGLVVTGVNWEGKNGEEIRPDKEMKALMEYINSATYVLPDTTIKF